MYALLSGIQSPGETYKDVHYKEIARAQTFKGLKEAYYSILNIEYKEDEPDPHDFFKPEYEGAFLSVGENTKTMYGPGKFGLPTGPGEWVEVPKNERYGVLIRFVKLDKSE